MFMSKALDFFCLMVDVRMPWDVLLSVRMVVGGCWWPNSVNVVLIGTAVLALRKIPIVLASAAEDMTRLTVLHSVWTGPLGFGFGFLVACEILSLR